jgi:cbb3-type cytochrome oxidase subunit 3
VIVLHGTAATVAWIVLLSIAIYWLAVDRPRRRRAERERKQRLYSDSEWRS